MIARKCQITDHFLYLNICDESEFCSTPGIRVTFPFFLQIKCCMFQTPTILAEYSILIIMVTAASPQGHVKGCWSNSVQPGKSPLAFSPPCYHECAPCPSWYGPWQANSSALHWAQGSIVMAPASHVRERRRSLPLKDPEKPRPHLNLGEAFKNLLSPDYMALLPFPLQDNQPNFPQRSKAGGDLFLSLRVVASCPATQWPWEARDLEGPSPLWGLGPRWQRKNTHNHSKYYL